MDKLSRIDEDCDGAKLISMEMLFSSNADMRYLELAPPMDCMCSRSRWCKWGMSTVAVSILREDIVAVKNTERRLGCFLFKYSDCGGKGGMLPGSGSSSPNDGNDQFLCNFPTRSIETGVKSIFGLVEGTARIRIMPY